jgi:hypothetical protein
MSMWSLASCSITALVNMFIGTTSTHIILNRAHVLRTLLWRLVDVDRKGNTAIYSFFLLCIVQLFYLILFKETQQQKTSIFQNSKIISVTRIKVVTNKLFSHS